jgi:hypothetical protein
LCPVLILCALPLPLPLHERLAQCPTIIAVYARQ